ncbi:8609_t:CDS:2, partial [Gigaspora margarita]
DRLYERYGKWKNMIHAERQNILILNQQILALHNNPPNQRNMALPVGFAQPEFHSCNEDHKDFVDRFISYITLAEVNNDANILTILDQSLKGEAREWYHREFDNKNWELENVLDNSSIGATIAHIRGANAVAITGTVASFPNIPLGLTGAQIIPARNVAEDWTIAKGRPTNAVLVAPNAREAGIQSGQRLWWMKKHYPTANKYVKMLEIGALRQGVYESVPSFWAKIQKYGDQLGYTPAQKKTYFLSEVRPNIRDEIYRIGQTKPINDIIDSLAELELHYGILQQAPSQPHHAPIAPAIPDTYVIPTYSKNPIVKESPKDIELSKILDSDSSSKELKKMHKL